jgi:MFS family permease
MMLNLNPKALRWGLALFIVLYATHLLLLPLLVGTEGGGKESSGTLYAVHQFLGLATCLVAGFVAARIAGERGFLHGAVVGGVGTLLTFLAALLWSLATGAKFLGMGMLPFWMMVNGFLAGFAGFVAANLKEGDDGGF